MQFNNLSVVEFNNIVKNIFDSEEMLYNCGVVGEISSFKITNSIAYFTIKDELAVLNCIWFNVDKEYKIGEKVKVVGRPNYYVKGGKLNFNVNFVTSFGEGEIFKKFLLLKEKLSKEGVFFNKKELPESVNNIGVITSSKGAVIQDIISVVKRRNPSTNIYIYPVKVQGVNSEEEIVKGFDIFGDFDKIDLLIVARGGGSNEDLSPFNAEIVAKACFKFDKPVISAVGHETDYTLLDLVADVRASTPSVAAEIAVKESKSKVLDLKSKFEKIKYLFEQKIEKGIVNNRQYVKNLTQILDKNITKNIIKIRSCKEKIFYLFKEKEIKTEHFLNEMKFKLEALNPMFSLDKGFALLKMGKERITKKSQIKENDELDIILKDAKITAKVIKVE